MIVIATLWLDNYQTLADITNANKSEYAGRHGMKTMFKKVDGKRNISFEKIAIILDAFLEFPECSWVWFSDCDSMITNMTKVVDPVPLTEPEVFMLITDDFNGINAGNMLVKNCEKGIEFLKFILSLEGSTQPGETNEQDVISTAWGKGNEGIKVIPQRSMNSYDMSLYPGAPNKGSITGYECQWQEGDLAIHWPGSSLEKRIELTKKYGGMVVR